MKLRHLFVLCCSAAFALDAHSEIYKRVDEDGHVTYSSTPIKGGKKLHLEPLPTMAPPPKANSTPEGFPRVDTQTQSRRDDTRRKILEDELATEQQALEEARRKLTEVQGTPSTGAQALRNAARPDEKTTALQEDVRTHEKNIEALNTELSNLNN
ncbi:MAG TPA: DUF4124 domain-containing protein [Sideroxyarcus sp.]|nr:DUF4124 domain-containing protein [Sideroxyarcus sp.]